MKVEYFLDTNILLYAALGRTDEPEKFEISRSIVAAWDFGLSAQVLGEFYVNVQRKSSRPLSADEAARWLVELSERPCADVDAVLVQNAAAISRRFRISYWDGAIVAAAERLGVAVLYSEDMSHGQSYGSVRVQNPFRSLAL